MQSLVAAYRFLGSRWADLDPLKRTERPKIPELEPAFYDLVESDLDITFSAANTYFSKAENMTLREILQALRETYCGTIGAEVMHCTDPAEKRWWQERLESIRKALRPLSSAISPTASIAPTTRGMSVPSFMIFRMSFVAPLPGPPFAPTWTSFLRDGARPDNAS